MAEYKKQADELVNKMYNYTESKHEAENCALISIDNNIELFYSLCGNEKFMWTSNENEIHNNLMGIKKEINKH